MMASVVGLNPEVRAWIIAPPLGYLKLLAPSPEGLTVSSRARGMYPFEQIFATRRSQINMNAQSLSKYSAPHAPVWFRTRNNPRRSRESSAVT
jgi:hypothetical protein